MSELATAAPVLSESEAGAEYALRLSLDAFEGPLDLLLHLIQKHELNIFDIPIAFVTQEYLRYLDAMVSLDLGIVGEYLVMAATLLQLKSAMLLPKPEREDEEEDDGDPREDLIRRLLEYQKFKDAAQQLHGRPQLFRETFPRPDVDDLPRPPRTLEDIDPPGLFELIEVFQSLMKRQRQPVLHEVTRHELSIKDAINRIATFLDATPRTTLTELVEHAPHSDETHRVVITFMSVLEMAKLRLVRLFQARITGQDLIVERAVLDIAEIALQLDFSDPDTVTHDTGNVGEAEQPDDIISEESTLEDETILADRLEALRGRPRLVRRDDTSAKSLQLAEEEAELIALAALHADMDDYDVDAVLAQAFQLANIGGDRTPSAEGSEHDASRLLERTPLTDAAHPQTPPQAASSHVFPLPTPPTTAFEEATHALAAADFHASPLVPLAAAEGFDDFVAQLSALGDEDGLDDRESATKALPNAVHHEDSTGDAAVEDEQDE